MNTVAFVLVAAFVLAMGFVAVTRRGKNLLEAVPPIDGETTLQELDLELTQRDRQAALMVTQVFMKGWARRTSHRLILTQPALGTGTRIVRYVIHLRPPAVDPSGWRDGVTTFVLDPNTSGLDDSGTLRLAPLHQPMNMPSWVGVRGEIQAMVAQIEALRG